MPPAYDDRFAAIEEKWQARWQSDELFRADRGDGPPTYVLTMYPYPSGSLHMGHVINYTLGDVIARWHLMRGDRVLSPMGWDAFGLPAENHAIRSGVHPEESTLASIDEMREQMRRAGWGYDWEKEIATCLPDYYRWTQWIFCRLLEADLAFQEEAPVNWCPSCHTVLANEQVHDGCCERCNSEVEPRDLEQWFFRMSDYAQRLLDGHDELRGSWPEAVLKMQEDWIGRSEGARLDFTIDAPGSEVDGDTLPVFTTRPDTTYGVTFMALAPEHPLVEELVRGTDAADEVMAAVRRMRRQPKAERTAEEAEKEGVFTGRHVVNPFDGSRAPIWVTNYALMEYGTGAVMAVPAHDQRDFLFARAYDIPVTQVIRPADEEPADELEEAFDDEGVMVDSGPFDGMASTEAIRAMTEHAADEGFGDFQTHYRLKDWLISRQRYWGCPIPVVHCDACGTVPVPDDELPVRLPREGIEFRPSGESPLATSEEFVETTCPDCGGEARRETDTMDTFVDSSWYFLRYPTPSDDERPWRRASLDEWLPVDQYVGGIEHATMHLIYARFLTMALHDLGHLDFDEPFARLFCQGMVCAPAFYCPTCKWKAPDEVSDPEADAPTCTTCGSDVRVQVHKMSKTKRNGVSPDEQLTTYGADTVRTAILFLGPADQDIEYDEKAVEGVHRFIKRVWRTVGERGPGTGEAMEAAIPTDLDDPWTDLRRKTHEVLQKLTETFENRAYDRFNTCISALMELLNAIRETDPPSPDDEAGWRVTAEAIAVLLRGLAPFAPHVAEELWETVGRTASIFGSGWPEVDENALVRDEVEVVIQVNGKVRGRTRVPAGLDEAGAREQVLSVEPVAERLEGKAVRKFIWVPDELANVVVG